MKDFKSFKTSYASFSAWVFLVDSGELFDVSMLYSKMEQEYDREGLEDLRVVLVRVVSECKSTIGFLDISARVGGTGAQPESLSGDGLGWKRHLVLYFFGVDVLLDSRGGENKVGV